MDDYAILRPRTPMRIPEAITDALVRGLYAPDGTLTCPGGRPPRWRAETERDCLYLSYGNGLLYGSTGSSLTEIGHLFDVLGYTDLWRMKTRLGKSQVTIAVGRHEVLQGVILEALGKSRDPETLRGRVTLWMTTPETLRLIITALGDAHRHEAGLAAVWTGLSLRTIVHTAEARSA